MKILLLSRYFPDDPETQVHGIYNRLKTIVGGLAKNNNELSIIFFVDKQKYLKYSEHEQSTKLSCYFGIKTSIYLAQLENDSSCQSSISGILKGALNFFNQANYFAISGKTSLNDFEKIIDQNFDLIFAHRLNVFPPLILTKKKLPPVVFDMDDVEHIALLRSILQPPFWLSKYLYYLHIPSLIWGERSAVRLATKTFVCSEIDATRIKKLGGNSVVIPNSVPIPDFYPASESNNILFVGTFNYQPNVSGIEFMLDKVWPLIIKTIPEARLKICGTSPEKIRHYQCPPDGVTFLGFVPDLSIAYRDARSVVCPILSGGGTRVKIIEAAAHGRAVVSTTIGAEGLDLSHGEEILIADTPEEFAEECIKLLLNHAASITIGSKAREKSIAIYDSKNIIEKISNIITREINNTSICG